MRPVTTLLTTTVLALTLSACSGSASRGGSPGPTTGTPAPTSSAPAPDTSVPSTTAPPPRTTVPPRTTTSPAPAPVPEPRVAGVIASGLSVPWGIAFLPDGSALVTERDTAQIVRVPAAGGAARPVGKVPGVRPGGEAGLLGIAVSASYATDHFVYVYFTAAEDNRVARLTYDGTTLGEPQVLLSGIQKADHHDGGRIAFGPDGMLYVATGDAGERGTAQDRGSVNGKILRLTPAGRPAPGNPYAGSPVWSYGHRNVQGLAWDSTGTLWASEFGQNAWDELNHIVPGGNYGWPVVEGPQQHAGFIQPTAWWRTEDASPSGIAVAGDAVWMAGLKGERLWRIDLRAGSAGPRGFFKGTYGRLRAVATAPDGSLWVSTSNRDGRGSPKKGDDQILRIVLS